MPDTIPIPQGATIEPIQAQGAPGTVPIPQGSIIDVAPGQQPPKDGLGWRILGGIQDAFGTRDFKMSDFATGPKQLITHPIDTLKMVGEAADAGQRAEYEKMYKTTSPAMKAARYVYGTVPVIGPALGNAADKFEAGDWAGGTAQTLGIAAQTFGGSPEVRANVAEGVRTPINAASKFVKAESNPNKLYNSYLGPVADNPHSVPNAPAPVMKAVLRDMEAAGDGEIAARIKDGSATIGDLDQARMRANRLARSIYRSPGNYSPGLAEGADKFASAIRDQIYPEIEKAHGMESGSLRGVKNLQGALMEAERNHGLVNKLVTQGLGAGAGAYLGNETGVPGGAYVGGAIGAKVAEPVASGINRGIIGLRTKGVAMNLPEPAAPPAAVVAPQRPIAGALPAPAVITPPPAPFNGVPIEGEYMPPPGAATYDITTPMRKGLLLPERTGGIPLGAMKMEEAMKLLKAKSVVVRDPRTGRMVRMYVTSGEAQ